MLILYFLIVIAGFLLPKSKTIVSAQMIICSIIFIFNTDNPDYLGYVGTYESAKYGGEFYQYFQLYAPLYKFLVFTCEYLDMSFNMFRAVVFFSCMLLMILTVKKITNNVGFVMSMYMIFPFVMDCIQIRNFIGAAVSVYGFRFLIDAENSQNKNAVKFAVTIVVASLFHYTMIAYLIYLMKFLKGKMFSLAYIVGMIGACLLAFVLQYYIKIVELSYLETTVSVETFMFMSGLTILVIYIIYKYRERLDALNISEDGGKGIYSILKISFIFIPMLIFHFDLYRYIRNVLIVFSCYAGDYFDKIRTPKGAILLSKVILFSVFILCYGLLLWRSAYYSYDISLLDKLLNSIEFVW